MKFEVFFITNRILIFLSLLPFFNIYYLNINPTLKLMLHIPVVLAALIIFIYMRKDKFILLISIMQMILLLSNIINSNVTVGIVFIHLSFYSIITLIYYNCKVDFEKFIQTLFYLFSSLIFLNFFSILIGGLAIYDLTLSREYLLGRENNVIRTILPGLIIVYFYSTFIKPRFITKIYSIIITIIGSLSVIYLGSTTGIIIIVILLLFEMIKCKFLPSYKTLLIIYSLIFVIITFFINRFDVIKLFVSNVLKNDLTFSGRSDIWDVVLAEIKNNLVLGIGYGNTLVKDNFHYVSEEHSLILQVLLISGVLGLLILILILTLPFKSEITYKNIYSNKIFSLGVILYLIIGLMESRFFDIGFWLLIIFLITSKPYFQSKLNLSTNTTD